VVKHHIRPFVGADLQTLLRANGIDMLVPSGGCPAGLRERTRAIVFMATSGRR